MNSSYASTAQRAQVLRLLDLPRAWSGRASYTMLDLDDDYGLRFVALWRQWLSDPMRCARLHVVLVAQARRSQEMNRQEAFARLFELIRKAAEPPPPPRRKTRPTYASKLRRIEGKVKRGGVKALRGRPDRDD